MSVQIPTTMKGAVLKEFGKPTVFGELPVPTLKAGQVLIQVKAAPINPSDLMFLQGQYPLPAQLPASPGIEGSGLIVKGFSEKESALVGKKVAFSGVLGSYAEYLAIDATSVLPVPEEISYEQAACSFVNPLTVLFMLQTTQKANVKAVIHTAAASQLGKQMVRHFQANGVDVINVVRRQEQVDQLKELGAKYILNSTDADFDKQLKELSQKLGATICYDAIAGDNTGRIINAMPNGSTIYVYGGLSGQEIANVGIGALIFERKTVTGYWMATEFPKYNPQELGAIIGQIPALLKGNLSSVIAKEFSQKDFNEGAAYYAKNMSAGKVVIKPTQN